MELLHIGAVALNQTPMDWAGNEQRIKAVIAAARARQVGLLLLPELCTTGYGCEDAFFSADVTRRAWMMLKAIEPQTRGMAVSVGVPIRRHGGLYNCACLLVDGQIVGFVAKEHLAGDGIHYEPRWFKPWPNGSIATLTVDGESYPFGDVFFEVGGVRIGFEICEDAWVAQRRGALDGHSMDVILNPSASHFAFDKHNTRLRLILEGSRSMAVAYVYANLLGNEAGRVIYDGGCYIAQNGEEITRSSRLTFDDWTLTSAVVDVEASRMRQASSSTFVADTRDPEEKCVSVACTITGATLQPPTTNASAWESSPHIKEEEFLRATTLGLYDYARKSRSAGFVLSISGGADSAAVACLVAITVARAIEAHGLARAAAELGYGHLASASERELIHAVLCCVYQATKNSSETTEAAARGLSESLGATFYSLNVQHIVDDYVALIEGALGTNLTWDKHDLALQNIQARTRGPSVWMLANLRRALLLATSNRSEAAVGYATMDGDTCGGLSPIAGIDKAFLRGWLRWLERVGPEGLHAIPALHAVNVQEPTAELRPSAQHQTDEADLMPYPVLDAIERWAIRDKRSPDECLQLIAADLPNVDDVTRRMWVTRFFRLWSQNQWKRERYAPSFHVDDKNLDPKTWCRFPILSSGFERELAELNSK